VKFLPSFCSVLFIVIALVSQVVQGALAATDELIPEDHLRAYARHQLAIAPKGGDPIDKVKAMWGPGPYTRRQVIAALNPTTKGEKTYQPKDHVQVVGNKIPGALDKAEALQQLDDFEAFNSNSNKLLTYTSPPTPSEPKGITIKVAHLRDALLKSSGIRIGTRHRNWRTSKPTESPRQKCRESGRPEIPFARTLIKLRCDRKIGQRISRGRGSDRTGAMCFMMKIPVKRATKRRH
jgi:hypothetical protein